MRLWIMLTCAAFLFAAGCDKADDAANGNSSNANGSGGSGTNMANAEGAVAISQDNASITFTGNKPSGESHSGKFETFSGSFKFDKENLAESAVNVTIDMNSIWTDGGPNLTNHLKDPDFFEVVQYPEATFEATSFESTGGDMYNIVGNLTLHGVTKEITLPAKVTQADGKLSVSISYALKRTDFGVNFDTAKVNDEVPLEITINADAA